MDRVGEVVTVELGGSAAEVALGQAFSCARLTTGPVKCWGANNLGQLGIGSTQDIGDGPGEMGTALEAVNLPAAIKQISAGGSHACAIWFSGQIRCWGLAASGQIGWDANGGFAYGDSSTELTPQLVALGTGFVPFEIAAGGDHTCARSSIGGLKCWGNASSGQLGYGDNVPRGRNPATMGDNLPLVPIAPPGVNVKRLDARVRSTCAVTSLDEVKCWGASSAAAQPALAAMGNLGDAPGEVVPTLPGIDLGPDFTLEDAVTNGWSACALMTNGVLKCWGLNGFGELGLGDTTMRGDQVSEMGVNLPRVPLP